MHEAVRAVGQFLVADVPLGATLERIAAHALAGLPYADAVGITLTDDRGRPATRVFTHPLATAVDQAQYDQNAGPCLDALRTGQTIRVINTDAVADRWPRYSHVARRHGVRSTLSLPLTAGPDALGVVNLYAQQHTINEKDEADAQLFATQAATVLANAHAYWNAHDLSVGLRTAIETRALVDAARAAIMARYQCTPDEAFQALVRAAQRDNSTLRDTARRTLSDPGQHEEPSRRSPN